MCNLVKFPVDWDFGIEPVDSLNRGTVQEMYFHQLVMLKKMIGLQLYSMEFFQPEIQNVMAHVNDCTEVPYELRFAEAAIAQLSQLMHYYALIREKRATHTVKFVTGQSYKPPRVNNERVDIDPRLEAKQIIKDRKMIKEGRMSKSSSSSGRNRNYGGRPSYYSQPYRHSNGRFAKTSQKNQNDGQFTRPYRGRGRGRGRAKGASQH